MTPPNEAAKPESALETENVFVDTQAFVASHFDWDGELLTKFADLAKVGRIRLITTDITNKEIKAQLLEKLGEARKASGRHRGIIRQATGFDLTSRLNEDNVPGVLIDQFDKFLNSARVKTIPTQQNVDQVMSDYFNGLAPFSEKKRSEFPDAFVVASLRAWCKSNQASIYVVSGDSDMASCCSDAGPLFHAISIASIIDKATVSKKTHDAIGKAIRDSEALTAEIEKQIWLLVHIEWTPYVEIIPGRKIKNAKLVRVTNINMKSVETIERRDDLFDCQMYFEADLEIKVLFESDAAADPDTTFSARQGSGARVEVRFDLAQPKVTKIEKLDLGDYYISLDYLFWHQLPAQ